MINFFYLEVVVQAHFNTEEQFPLVLALLTISKSPTHGTKTLGSHCFRKVHYSCKSLPPLLPGFLFHWAMAAVWGVAFSRYLHKRIGVKVCMQNGRVPKHTGLQQKQLVIFVIYKITKVASEGWSRSGPTQQILQVWHSLSLCLLEFPWIFLRLFWSMKSADLCNLTWN